MQFAKCVSASPNSSARSFILATNSSSLPHRCSAIATAQSFAETTAIHLSISLTLMRSPSSRYTQLPPKDAARALAVTVSSRLIFPLSMASTMRSMVMTFVTLAGNRRLCASFSYRSVPVSFSISTAEGADMVMSPSRSGSSAKAGAEPSNIAKHSKKTKVLFMSSSHFALTQAYALSRAAMPGLQNYVYFDTAGIWLLRPVY